MSRSVSSVKLTAWPWNSGPSTMIALSDTVVGTPYRRVSSETAPHHGGEPDGVHGVHAACLEQVPEGPGHEPVSAVGAVVRAGDDVARLAQLRLLAQRAGDVLDRITDLERARLRGAGPDRLDHERDALDDRMQRILAGAGDTRIVPCSRPAPYLPLASRWGPKVTSRGCPITGTAVLRCMPGRAQGSSPGTAEADWPRSGLGRRRFEGAWLALRPVELLLHVVLRKAALHEHLLRVEDHVRVAADIGDRLLRP